MKLNQLSSILNHLLTALLLTGSVVVTLVPLNATANPARSTFSVNVVVQPVTRVDQANHSNLVISESDVARGYIEVNDPVAMRIASNSERGFALDVLPVNDVFSNVVVRGMGSEVALGADGGMIVQRWQHAQTVSVNLKFQFALRPDTQPGEYAFPLHMAVRPL